MTLEQIDPKQLFNEIKEIKQDIKEIKEYLKPKPKIQSEPKHIDEPAIVKEAKKEICQLTHKKYDDIFNKYVEVWSLTNQILYNYEYVGNTIENMDYKLLQTMDYCYSMCEPTYYEYLVALLYLMTCFHQNYEYHQMGYQLYQSFKKLFIKDKKYIDENEKLQYEEVYKLCDEYRNMYERK